MMVIRSLGRVKHLMFLMILMQVFATACNSNPERPRTNPQVDPTPPVKSSPFPIPPPIVTFSTPEMLPQPEDASLQPPENGAVYLPALASFFAATQCDGTGQSPPASVSGSLEKWHPMALNFTGPETDETATDPNPFLDYRLQVMFLGPSGQVYDVPGFYAGDGQGGGQGGVWQVRFAPDETGIWHYCASFRTGPGVAVELDSQVGVPVSFDGTGGSFEIREQGANAQGFLKWGRLEYVGKHYLKFRDGPYWIKGGTNSPENFLGYAGFDNTFDQGGIIGDFLHAYAPHVDDWQEGDPNFISVDHDYDGRGIIGALNYLSGQHVNSLYLLPMNLGGDGQDTYPFLSPDGTRYSNTHYDVSKLDQWLSVFEHAQEKGIALHMVLNETEPRNREWLDGGDLGVERKLFYREMIARFGHLLALKWNLSEENVFSREEIVEFSDYIQTLDWAKHPMALHNPANWMRPYEQLLGDNHLLTMAVQYEGEKASDLVEQWRQLSAENGYPWIVDMDENNPAGVGLAPDNAGWLRKTILYDVYFSGGNIEWYAGYYDLPIGGDVNLEDFRTREAMWRFMWYARRFMEDNLPFWEMTPADELLSEEANAFGGGEVFSYGDEIFAVYLPVANPSGVLQVGADREYRVRWYDPRTGEFVGEALSLVADDGHLMLGAPPSNPDGDWVVLVTAMPEPTIASPPAGYP